jgi:hypothetical protein
MPLNKKGKKIKKSMVKQYGKKKGEAVFYAMENSGKLKGVKKNKNFPYTLNLVWWEDIVSESSWSDIVDIKKAKTAVCCSIGWIVKEDSKSTILMADYSFEDNKEIKQGGSYTTIPTKNILKIKKIKI